MNERFDLAVIILELTGTVAFAASGAITAVRRGFDIFGVMTTGVTAAVGGGVMRDIILGRQPVSAFSDPLAIATAALVSVLIFILLAVTRGFKQKTLRLYNAAMLILDTLGLGIFTVTGITAALRSGNSGNTFLLVFSGVITGVGGGILRDIIVGKRPEIFVGKIYACASALGALIFIWLYGRYSFALAATASITATSALRITSAVLRLDLPRVENKSKI